MDECWDRNSRFTIIGNVTHRTASSTYPRCCHDDVIRSAARQTKKWAVPSLGVLCAAIEAVVSNLAQFFLAAKEDSTIEKRTLPWSSHPTKPTTMLLRIGLALSMLFGGSQSLVHSAGRHRLSTARRKVSTHAMVSSKTVAAGEGIQVGEGIRDVVDRYDTFLLDMW